MTRRLSQQKLPLQPPTTRVELDGRIAIARFGPLVPGACHAISRQTELLAPAKLALAPGGECELRAEVLRSSDVDAPKLARSALDLARAWLSEEPPGGEATRWDGEDLAGALAELPAAWVWERGDADEFRIHATAFGESVRLTVRAAAGGAQVIARSALATPDPGVHPALARFALETNRRLRLARIGVSTADDETSSVSWDAVAPPGVDLAGWLPALVEAVVRAHAATRRSLRALCHDAIARTYLDARKPAPRRRPVPRG